MKLWRKLAMKEGKKDGRRPGRSIRNQMAWEAMMTKKGVVMTPILRALFINGGLSVPPLTAFKVEGGNQ